METKKINNYLVVILLILAILFFSNLFSQKNYNSDGKELLAAPSQVEQESCDPPMELDIDGNCVDPGPGGGGGGISVSAPTVSTSAATGVGEDGATLNGNISATGNENGTSRGFNYGPTQSYGSNTTESGSFSTGDFSATLTGLECDTDYYFQAYAANSAGSGTGSAQIFTTDSCSNPSNNNDTPPVESSSNSGSGSGSGGGQSPSSGGGGSAIQATTTPPVTVSTSAPPSTPTSTPPELATDTPAVLPLLTQLLSSVSQDQKTSSVPLPDLYLENIGNRVRQLQTFLNQHGSPLAENGPGSPGQETDYFLDLTQNSLKHFQQAHNLPITGYYGHLTWQVMLGLERGQ